MAEHDRQEIESIADAKAAGLPDAALWLKRIKAAKAEEDDWRKQACEAVKIYEADKDNKTSFNLFHSNVETLNPALYNTTPIPDVRRRFGDKDPVAKMGADIIERAVSYSLDQYAFDAVMMATVRSATVSGRGTARVRYKPQPTDPTTGEGVGTQVVMTEPVGWDKWGHGPALSWEDVTFIWFEHDLTRDQVLALVGEDEEAQARVRMYGATKADGDKDDKDGKGIVKTLCVYEVWDKDTKSLLFLTPSDDQHMLKVETDPMGLPDFFPCPAPLQLMTRVKSLVPMSPYEVYRPLLEELDKITKRITKLVANLKVRGLVDAKLNADLEALRNAEDMQYISAQDATAFATGAGGLEKAIAHWPMAETIAALQQLYVQRDQIKATIYEVTGLSDILRGVSDPSETATAQNIKQEWGSLRIKDMQAAVARFARDLFRMKAAVISKHFTPQNIAQMTSLPNMQQQGEDKVFMQAVQLLRQDANSYRIDIESDSTVRADLGRKQEQMNQFLAGTAQFSGAIAGFVQGAPQIAQPALPVLVEVFSQFARHFKLGKQAEDALESLAEQAQQMAGQPPEEDPAQKKAKADMESQKMKSEAEMASLQAKTAHEERMAQIEEQKAQMDLQIKMAELEIKKEELRLKQEGMRMEAQAKVFDLQVRQQQSEMDMRKKQEARPL